MMEYANISAVKFQIDALDTDLTCAYQEYEREQSRVKNYLNNLIDGKNRIIAALGDNLQRELEIHEKFQMFLYNQAIFIIKKKVDRVLLKRQILFLEHKADALGKIISQIDKYGKSLVLAINALETLDSYLINNTGGIGYVEFNTQVTKSSLIKNNIQLLKNVDDRIEKTGSDDSIDLKAERKSLRKLRDYIIVGNDYWNEIEKIEMMAARLKKRNQYLPKEKAYNQKIHEITKTNITKKKQTVNEINNLINVCEKKINDAIKEHEENYIIRYEESIKKLELSIKSDEEKLKNAKIFLGQLNDSLDYLLSKRQQFIDFVNEPRNKRGNLYMNPIESKRRQNEEKIIKQNSLIENQKDYIKRINSRIDNYKMQIIAKKAEYETSSKAFKLFVNSYRKSYAKVNGELKEQLGVLMYDQI